MNRKRDGRWLSSKHREAIIGRDNITSRSENVEAIGDSDSESNTNSTKKFCSTFEILSGRAGESLEEMKELDEAESRQFWELTPNKSGPCLALCNRITEETRATWAEPGVLEPAQAPSSPRPRNESDQTHVLATTTNVGQGRIVTHRRRVAIRGPDPRRDCLGTTEFESIVRVTLGRYSDGKSSKGTRRSVYSSSQENAFRSCRGSRGAYGRAMA